MPGLAHSSPIVWGDRVYVTTAVSSDPAATFRRGLYGDGDASTDRSRHRWLLMAFDKRTGRRVWERVAYEGEPLMATPAMSDGVMYLRTPHTLFAVSARRPR